MVNPKSLKNLRPIQLGEVRNPNGRQAAGAVVKEYLNSMVEMGLTEKQLRLIARHEKEPVAKRAAANRLLRMIEAPDLADYQDLVTGEKTPKQLRDKGINTEAIKKIKPVDGGNEIELYDRSGEDFDRIMDRTTGYPKHEMDIKSDEKPIGPDATVARILAILAGGGGVVPPAA